MSTQGTNGSGVEGSKRPRRSGSRPPTPSSGGGNGAASEETATQGTNTTDVVEIEDDGDGKVGNKKKKSKIWDEFTEKTVGGKPKAECDWCHKLLSAETRNGTSHLHGHLKICESRNIKKGLKQSTLKLSAKTDGSVVVEKYVFDQDLCRKELPLMICVHEYPLSIVDHAGFRRFCAAMQPLFKVVSRNTIRKDILDMHEVQKISMVKFFQKIQARIAVTTDLWTANHQKKGYMAVTVHFIDDDWKLKSFLLR